MTTCTPETPALTGDRDAGFTLIEVIVAMVIMAIVATAALYFFTNGTRAVTNQQRTQNAVDVANDAMEAAHSVAAKNVGVTAVSGLVAGRMQSKVDASWALATAANVDGLAQTYPAADPAAVGASVPAVPITTTARHSKILYTTTTLIGTCYRATAAAAEDCGKLAGQLTDPGVAPAGTARVMRVMVLVTWPAVGSACANGTCSYQVSSLLDPNDDQKWNNITRPIAVDDVATTDVNTGVSIPVLANDVIGPVTSNPVFALNVVDTPAPTLTKQAGGTVLFTPASGISGYQRFTYSLKDGAGRQSNLGQVTVGIKPKAVADTASTSKDAPIVIPVLANDVGTPTAVVVDSQAASGLATPQADNTVRFDPQGHYGTFTFQYHLENTSPSGPTLQSASVAVRVTVSQYPAPLVSDFTVVIPAANPSVAVALGMALKTGNPTGAQYGTGYKYEIESTAVAPGQMKVGANDYNATTNKLGTEFSYAPQANTIGTYTIQYLVQGPDGVRSVPKTVTIQVVPQVNNFTTTVARGQSVDVRIIDNTVPTNFPAIAQLAMTNVTVPTCGTFPANQQNLQNGLLKFTAPASAGTCTFTYKLVGSGTNSSLVSNVATVTVRVT